MIENMDILKDFPVQKIFAEDQENKDLVAKFNILSAPTLVVVNDGSAETYTGASSIIGFAKKIS